MIETAKERGPLFWKIKWIGIKGGIIRIKVYRNRLSFVKSFHFNDDVSFNIAKEIINDKVKRILHFKNQLNPNLGTLAQYCLDANEIIESKEDLI
jgi:hypothetical protein